MKFALWPTLLLAALLTSCSSLYKPLRVDEVQSPLAEIRHEAMKALPLGLRLSSPNGRELNSLYYIIKNGQYVDAVDQNQRWTAKIVIPGERRPYDVEIYVFKEVRVDSSHGIEYRTVGQDLRLAKRVKDELLKRLAQRREDLNIIDDFRVF